MEDVELPAAELDALSQQGVALVVGIDLKEKAHTNRVVDGKFLPKHHSRRAGSKALREGTGAGPHLQHGGQDPLVATQREEVVEVNGRVDGGGRVLPEQRAVLRVQQQRPVEHVQEQHHLIAPRVLAGHADKHLLQQLDPQHLVEGVQTKQLLA